MFTIKSPRPDLHVIEGPKDTRIRFSSDGKWLWVLTQKPVGWLHYFLCRCLKRISSPPSLLMSAFCISTSQEHQLLLSSGMIQEESEAEAFIDVSLAKETVRVYFLSNALVSSKCSKPTTLKRKILLIKW